MPTLMRDSSFVIKVESDSRLYTPSFISALNAVLSDASTAVNEDMAELNPEESTDTELPHVEISAEIPVLSAVSADFNDETDELMYWDREPMADPRTLISVLNSVLSDESLTVNESLAKLNAEESEDMELLRMAFSVETEEPRVMSVAPNDDNSVPVSEDSEETVCPQTLTSLLNTVISDEFATVNEDTAKLSALESTVVSD